MAQSFKLFFITFAARVFMTCCEQGATINNFFPSLIIGFNILSMTSMLFISASETRICTSSMIHSSFFWLFINSGDEYPLSTFKPLVSQSLSQLPGLSQRSLSRSYLRWYMYRLLFSPPAHHY